MRERRVGRFPVEPLSVRVGDKLLMERVGLSQAELGLWKRRGLDVYRADWWATACGFHPGDPEVWGDEWFSWEEPVLRREEWIFPGHRSWNGETVDDKAVVCELASGLVVVRPVGIVGHFARDLNGYWWLRGLIASNEPQDPEFPLTEQEERLGVVSVFSEDMDQVAAAVELDRDLEDGWARRQLERLDENSLEWRRLASWLCYGDANRLP